jgi:hypothetical protein
MKIAAAVRAKQIPFLHCLRDDNAAKKRVSVFGFLVTMHQAARYINWKIEIHGGGGGSRKYSRLLKTHKLFIF